MKIDKRPEELEAKVKPEQKVFVWHVSGEYYYNDAGEKLKKEELPQGENVLNIIIDVV